MPAHRLSRAADAVERIADRIPWPSTVIGGLVLVAVIGLCTAATTWPPLDSAPSSPTAAVTITPDDPAAPTPVPVQILGR